MPNIKGYPAFTISCDMQPATDYMIVKTKRSNIGKKGNVYGHVACLSVLEEPHQIRHIVLDLNSVTHLINKLQIIKEDLRTRTIKQLIQQ